MSRKGLILAGGTGSRLFPVTEASSKQLMPVYDKPMIYYPLSVLMLSGLRQVALIVQPARHAQFIELLGDGQQWGMSIEYIEQPSPDGLAQAYLLGERFLDGDASTLILGDNLFFGHGISGLMASAGTPEAGGTVFAYRVADPERYGVVEIDGAGTVLSLEEKPAVPRSHFAVTGCYVLDGTASQRARSIRPSARGELEITSLLQHYIDDGQLRVETMGRGYAWLDTGTHESLLEAANFVATLQHRQGMLIGSPDEIAWRNGWIDDSAFATRVQRYSKTSYGRLLEAALDE